MSKSTLGSRLVQLREQLGFSINKMAKELNLPVSNLSGYEKDKNIPSGLIILNIANYFNVSTDWLLKGDEAKTKKAAIITDPDLEFAIQLLTDLYTSQGPDMRGWAKITFNNAFETEIAKKKKDSTAGIA